MTEPEPKSNIWLTFKIPDLPGGGRVLTTPDIAERAVKRGDAFVNRRIADEELIENVEAQRARSSQSGR